jgi:hypothetical protein
MIPATAGGGGLDEGEEKKGYISKSERLIAESRIGRTDGWN